MQDKYQIRQTERTNQRIKILINRPDFQKDITFLRNKWKIPQKGLKTENENEEWNNWILDETDNYYDTKWPKETKKILKLRSLKKYNEAEEIKKTINSGAPLNALNNDVWVIIINYDLPPKWHDGVKNYLLSGDPKYLRNQTGLTVSFNWDHGVMRPSIEFDKDTTLTDLKRVWSWAKRLLKRNKNTKFQPIKNLDRDKRAYELEKEGKTPTEMEDIIEKEFGAILSYNELTLAIKRYKKRLNIN